MAPAKHSQNVVVTTHLPPQRSGVGSAVAPRREWIVFAALIVLAGALRLQRLDYAEFVWDQAHISMKAIDMARGGQIAWTGVRSSTGIDSFMGLTWVLAVPYALSLDPLFATAYVALLNTASVAAGYLLARRWLGPLAAAGAMLLYAVNPWAIELSRKIWAGTPMPLFTVAYAATGWLAFVRGKRWALIAHALLAAWLLQIHFSGLPAIAISAVWAIAFRRRIDWRVALLGAFLATLTFVPYLLVDARQNWFNLGGFRDLAAHPASIDLESTLTAWRISTGIDFASLAGPDLAPALEAAWPNARFLFPLEGALIVAGLVAAGWLVIRRRPWRQGFDDRSAAAFMAVTWLLMPPLLQARHVWPVTAPYFLITYPAQYILIGLLVAEASRLGRIVRIGLLGLIGAIALAQVIEVLAVYTFLAGQHTPNGAGTPMTFVRQAGEMARRLSDELGGAEIIVLSDGADPRMFEFPRTADVLFYGRPHRTADVYTTLVLPPQPAVYWAPAGRGSAELLLESLTPEVYEARLPTRKGGGPYRFYRWGGEVRVPPMRPLDAPPAWRNGVSLIGAFVEGEAGAGQTLRWALVWRIGDDADTSKAYHWFNHLLDAEGRSVAQADGPAYLPFFWRTGDTIVTWFDLPLPADLPSGDYSMRVGMYEYPALINVPLADGSGEFTLIRALEIR